MNQSEATYFHNEPIRARYFTVTAFCITLCSGNFKFGQNLKTTWRPKDIEIGIENKDIFG
jgi:hypothetical protein